MKKKIALFLMFIVSSLSILTGCNLFSTNNYNALSSIVATNGDVSITRQDLISAYNNGGYYYNYLYGYTQEEAIRMTIDELIDQEYLLKYIDSQGSKYSLSSDDYCIVISDTWEYIDNRMSTYVEAVRNDLGLSKEELSTEEEAEEIFSTLDGTLLPLDKSQKAKVESFFNISGMKTMEFQRNGAALRIIFSDGRTSYIFMFHPEDGAIICEEKEDTIALILNNDAILLVLNDSDILEMPLQ